MKFRVVDNLQEAVMLDFIGFVRYTTFRGDLAQLYLIKNQANQEAKKRRGGHEDDDDDGYVEDVFTGCQMSFRDIPSEIAVWQEIESICNIALAKYDTTYEEDEA